MWTCVDSCVHGELLAQRQTTELVFDRELLGGTPWVPDRGVSLRGMGDPAVLLGVSLGRVTQQALEGWGGGSDEVTHGGHEGRELAVTGGPHVGRDRLGPGRSAELPAPVAHGERARRRREDEPQGAGGGPDAVSGQGGESLPDRADDPPGGCPVTPGWVVVSPPVSSLIPRAWMAVARSPRARTVTSYPAPASRPANTWPMTPAPITNACTRP